MLDILNLIFYIYFVGAFINSLIVTGVIFLYEYRRTSYHDYTFDYDKAVLFIFKSWHSLVRAVIKIF